MATAALVTGIVILSLALAALAAGGMMTIGVIIDKLLEEDDDRA